MLYQKALEPVSLYLLLIAIAEAGQKIGEVSSLVVPQPGRSPATHISRSTFSACLPFPVGAQAKANMKR